MTTQNSILDRTDYSPSESMSLLYRMGELIFNIFFQPTAMLRKLVKVEAIIVFTREILVFLSFFKKYLNL